jgi:hypothetical protein
MAELARSSEIDAATLRLLKFGAVPLWAGAGFADWLCHRLPTLLGLFFEVDAGVLALTLSAFAVHQATAIWDVAYAGGRRRPTGGGGM